MLRSVLHSPIGFFDSNPSGRILNRFSSDTGQVDDLLPPAFYDFVALAISAISYIIITLIVVPFTGIFNPGNNYFHTFAKSFCKAPEK